MPRARTTLAVLAMLALGVATVALAEPGRGPAEPATTEMVRAKATTASATGSRPPP
jgi:hypothetical protein